MLASVDITSNSSTPLTEVGTRYVDGKGRTFFYAKAGAANLTRGKLVVTADPVTNHLNMSFQTAPAVGDKSVKVTLGATALTADQYKDGWLVVQDGTGEGRAYPVEGNPAADSAGTATIYLKEAIDTAGALAEANVDLVVNRYSGVVISAADQADVPLGVPVSAITAAYYGWIQTWGAASVLMDEAVAIGKDLTIGSSVTGAVEMLDAAGEPRVGKMGLVTAVDTEYQLAYLEMDR